MIEPGYVRTMARYNAWQNKQLMGMLDEMSTDDLTKERGAFFGSLMGTINHLLWGDLMWLSRFDATVNAPDIAGTDSHKFCRTYGDWNARRFRTDGQIKLWADKLRAVELQGDLKWYSGLFKKDYAKPMAECVVHFFNHQTHHRGQVHMMLTSMGREAPVSDLIFLPEDM